MNCPYCGKPMEEGILTGSAKTCLRFRTEADARKKGMDRVWDAIDGKGLLIDDSPWCTYKIPACYCKNCQKMILDAKLR